MVIATRRPQPELERRLAGRISHTGTTSTTLPSAYKPAAAIANRASAEHTWLRRSACGRACGRPAGDLYGFSSMPSSIAAAA